MAGRKRKLATPEQSASTLSAVDAQEVASFASSLQAIMGEVRQLREEQRLAQQEFAEALRQRDAEIQRLQQASNGCEQISPSENLNSRGGMCGRVARASADGDASGAHARDCVEPFDSLRTGNIKLKPDIYDGSVSLNEFLIQFELIARANRWTGEAKTAILISCLRGKARGVLESVFDLENVSYDDLKSKLELRFGETHSLQNYYSQFTNRRQKFGEDIASLGSDLERLSQLAYPECSQVVRDKIACAQFVSALSNRFVSRTLQLEGITSLRLAIERARTIRLIQESDFEQKKKNINFEGRGENRNNNNSGSNYNREARNYKGNVGNNYKGKEGKFNKNKFGENGNNERKKTGNGKECWECGKEGHFRSECPGRRENKE